MRRWRLFRTARSRTNRWRLLGGTLLAWVGWLGAAGNGAEPDLPAASGFRPAVEAVQKAAHAHPERSAAYYRELERGFRELQARFSGEAEVYAELLFVADHTTGPGSEALARQILEWPAPAAVKAKAAGVLRKKAALNRVYELTLPGLDGRDIRLADRRGKVVLLDFWATWCPPCRERLPELAALYSRLHDRGLEMVGISFDDDLSALRRFLEREKIPWPQAADGKGWDGPRAGEFGITSLPALWLIDRQGRLREIEAGERLAARVEELLGE